MTITNTTLSSICSFYSNQNTSGESSGNDEFGDISIDSDEFPTSLDGFLSDQPYQTPVYKSLDFVIKCDQGNYDIGILGADNNIYFMPNFPFKDTNSANGRVLKINTEDDSVTLIDGSIDVLTESNRNTFSNGLRLNEDVIFVPGKNVLKPDGSGTQGYLYNLKTNTTKIIDHKINGYAEESFYSRSCVKKGTEFYRFNSYTTNNLDIAITNLLTEETTIITDILPKNIGIRNGALSPNGLIYAVVDPKSATNGIYVIDPETRTVVDSFGKSADVTGEWGECYRPFFHPNGNMYLIMYAYSKMYFSMISPTTRSTSTSALSLIPKRSFGTNAAVLSTNGFIYLSYAPHTSQPAELIEIDIATKKGKIVHSYPTTGMISDIYAFVHPNGKLYMIPCGPYNETSICVYDTKCPAKDPSIFLKNHVTNFSWAG